MTAELRELFPESRALSAREAYGGLGLAELARGDRPYLIANMVSSVDGRATLAGKSGGVSSDNDRELFHELRTQVDAVMAGTSTIAIENYGPLATSPELRERRVALGLAPSPVAITAARSLSLPIDAPLLQDPESSVIVLTNSEAAAPEAPAKLELLRTPGESIDFATAFKRLRSDHDIGTILLEGGPTLLGVILTAGLLDELFLTVSPLAAGSGDGPAIIEAATLPEPARLELRSALESEGSLFLRYAVAR